MFFIFLTFAAAIFIEALGSLVSVIGISALFGANPIIIALAIALDVGKIVTVSLLYTYWKQLSKLMKGYALIAAGVTMIITSSGAAGYLSAQFQTAIQGTKEGELKVSVLKDQQAKYEARKKQIDDQIANLPTKTTVTQRLRLMKGFKDEQAALDKKITDLDKQLPDAQIAQIGTEAHAGPILYIAKAFNVTVEQAVKYVIGMIITVFDPLAVFLIIAGNFLVAQRKKKLETGELVHRTSPLPVWDEVKKAAEETQRYTGPEVDFGPPVGKEFPNEEPAPMVGDELERFNRAQEEGQTGGWRRDDGTVIYPQMPDFVLDPLPQPALHAEPAKVNIDVPMVDDEELEARRLKAQAERDAELEEQARREAEQATAAAKRMQPGMDFLPTPRQEITKSTLGLVQPDASTIVDAPQVHGFKRSQLMTTPTKKKS